MANQRKRISQREPRFNFTPTPEKRGDGRIFGIDVAHALVIRSSEVQE